MVIILPGETVETPSTTDALTPKQIVAELDRFIVGQNAAKRAVAIALRNRWRRQQLAPELREEIAPKNIVMIGPTGVGKTEIARRLARLAHSPFLKIEASKFTEVGYVGRDVESIIRDLTELGVKMVREEKELAVRAQAERAARERLIDLLLPPPPSSSRPAFIGSTEPPEADSHHETREKMAHWLDEGKLEDREVEMEVREQSFPSFEIFSSQGVEEMGVNMKDMLPGLFGGRTRRQKMRVGEAREILIGEEAAKLVDQAAVTREALERVEQHGIVFLDEIDKVAGRESGHGGPDVSREGVQRDLLPIVEGTTVNTRYGMIRTDHILFIAAGAFHVSKPSDLIPELQGRFPIRVELDSLSQDDFARILREPHNALTRQYSELLATEGVQLRFTDEAVTEIARLAASVNQRTENIGARRLQTILERVLDDLSFDANERSGDEVVIDAEYVRGQVEPILRDEDLSRYIL